VSADLPWEDPSVDALPLAIRAGLGEYWQARARAELRVSHAFRELHDELVATGVSDVVRELAARTVDDEVRHSELCRRLAERYAGHAIEPVQVEPATLPAFASADPQLRVALHVMGLSCINETIASTWLSGCISLATAPLAHEATRFHLREEIDHARLGWAHLASKHVSAGTRAALGSWLARLLRANVPQWFRPDAGLPLEGVPDHGVPSAALTRTLVLDALRDVVLPGLTEVGIDPTSGHEWLAGESRPAP
jgi:hypothetical protein